MSILFPPIINWMQDKEEILIRQTGVQLWTCFSIQTRSSPAPESEPDPNSTSQQVFYLWTGLSSCYVHAKFTLQDFSSGFGLADVFCSPPTKKNPQIRVRSARSPVKWRSVCVKRSKLTNVSPAPQKSDSQSSAVIRNSSLNWALLCLCVPSGLNRSSQILPEHVRTSCSVIGSVSSSLNHKTSRQSYVFSEKEIKQSEKVIFGMDTRLQ